MESNGASISRGATRREAGGTATKTNGSHGPTRERARATERADDATVVVANYDDPPTDPVGERLRPYEATVYRL